MERDAKRRLSESDKKFIKECELRSDTVAGMLNCSIGTVEYYRNRGIWAKKKRMVK